MKKNKKYKAALIGCGKIGIEVGRYRKEVQPATHAGAFQIHPQIELVGFVDIDQKRLKIAAKNFPGVPLFSSAEAMLKKQKPDIISIATQPDSHPKLVKLAAQYKTKAILCEKPIALSLKEAKEMIRICKENNSLLFINHSRHFDYLLRKWRDKIKKGLIGHIYQGNFYYYNGLFNNGTHNIDLLRFFLGDVDWVRAITNERTSWNKKDKNVDAQVAFKSGAMVFLQSLPKNYGFLDLYFYGTKGRFAIKNLGYQVEYRKLIKNKYYKGYYQLSDLVTKEGKLRSYMKAVINHLVACLDKRERPISTGKDGLAALRVLFALRESAKNNGKVIKIKC